MTTKTSAKRLTLNVEPNNNQHSSQNINQNNQQQRSNNRSNLIYGWRLHCLYFVIFLLMALISINLALTLWILKVMEVSSDGIGQLKVVEGGVQLEGQAIILDELRTSHLRSRHGMPITFESSKNITFNTRDADGLPQNQLFLGHDKFEIQTKAFRVADIHGNTLFYVDRDTVEIASNSLKIEGEGGVTIKDSIQTSMLRAEPGKDLKLESPTRSLFMHASQEMFIQSKAGSIEMTSLNDIELKSEKGNIRLEADKIILSKLREIEPPTTYLPDNRDTSLDKMVYQVCVCENGRLFLIQSSMQCRDGNSDTCR